MTVILSTRIQKDKYGIWGYNGYGQLSQGNTNNINEPTTVKIEKPKTDPDEEHNTKHYKT